MNQRRVGRSLYVLRTARSLRQSDVAEAAGVSQPTVSAIERGRWAAMSLRTLSRVFDAVEADVEVLVRFRGGEIDRLLDERHAAVVASLARLLRDRGWRVLPEVSFNHFGDRGSIDLLAYHPPARIILVVEVKTEISSAEETLRRLDVKGRIAPLVAPDRFGESPDRVARLLAIRDSTANRERIARLDPLFGPAFPLRGRRMTAWIRSPDATGGGLAGGLLFVRDSDPADRVRGLRRVRAARRPGQAPLRA